MWGIVKKVYTTKGKMNNVKKVFIFFPLKNFALKTLSLSCVLVRHSDRQMWYYYGNISSVLRRVLLAQESQATVSTSHRADFSYLDLQLRATSCLTRDFVLTRSGTFSTDMRACTRECNVCYALRFFHTIYLQFTNGRICVNLRSVSMCYYDNAQNEDCIYINGKPCWNLSSFLIIVFH